MRAKRMADQDHVLTPDILQQLHDVGLQRTLGRLVGQIVHDTLLPPAAERFHLDVAFVEKLIVNPENKFTTTPEKSEKFAAFQFRTGQIKERPASWKDLFFPDLDDRQGS